MKRKKITKELILSAAIQVANTKGINHITLKDVAEQLEIKIPSLYNHIQGLDDLYNLLAYEGLSQLLEALTSSVTGLSGSDALISLGNAYIKFAQSFTNLYLAAQRVPYWKNEATKQKAQAIIDLLLKIISVYQLEEEHAIHIIRTLRSYFHGFSLLESQESFGLPLKSSRSFSFGMEAILKGLELL